MTALSNNCVPQMPLSSHHQDKSSMAKSCIVPSTPVSVQNSLLTTSSLSYLDLESIAIPKSIPHQTQDLTPYDNDDDDLEYFSEPFFTEEELDSVAGLEMHALPIIPTGFKEDNPYIMATNDMKRNLLPGDMGTHGHYYMVLNGRTCSVHHGWDATTNDAKESWQDVFLENHVGPPGYYCHKAVEQEATLPPRTPPSSPHHRATGCCSYSDKYMATPHSAPSSPSISKRRMQSPFAGHLLNLSNIFHMPQSTKAGRPASTSTSKSYILTLGPSRVIPSLLQKDIWERVPVYWVVKKGRHPGVFHGIVIKAATAEQACMHFVQAFMDGKILQM
ncbi:hypothetical protein ARMGADRAFT_1031924 [Armillaria gallica]|uniref:Uncharacterized protein n=1 Tax=Armillaria gallica TaxID=47427 RepID=A0A2H3DSK5_ARMGA|nr:hypothetical protein ARMGADRAFT_1031924 [Armillaria gallica]